MAESAFDLTDESVPAETRLNVFMKWLADLAGGPSAWPKMDCDERINLKAAADRLTHEAASIVEPAKSLDAAAEKELLCLRLIKVIGAAYEIGQYANVTKSSQIYSQSVRAKDAGARSGKRRRENRAWLEPITQAAIAIRAKNPSWGRSAVASAAIEQCQQHGLTCPGAQTVETHLKELEAAGSFNPRVTKNSK